MSFDIAFNNPIGYVSLSFVLPFFSWVEGEVNIPYCFVVNL